jgi:hypothetical protein
VRAAHDRALGGLPEDCGQRRGGDAPAVENIAQHLTGADTGQLVGIPHED